MKKRSLFEYAKTLFEIDSEHKKNNNDGVNFSATIIIEQLKVSPTQSRRILKELSDEEFLVKNKVAGLREPMYVLHANAKEKLQKLEKEALVEPKKITRGYRRTTTSYWEE